MRYEILGRVSITVDNKKVSAGTNKMEVLLRTLLIRNGQVVSTDQLIQELWGDNPPARAVAALHVYVSQLRKLLKKLARSNDVITTRAPGYVLDLGNDHLDLNELVALFEQGRQRLGAGDFAAAADILGRTLDLFQEPIQASSYDGPIMREFADWAEELRVECVELLACALLGSDQANAAVRLLHSLTTEYPLRENLYAFLMEALSQAGRRADALQVYRTARSRIRDELGLEPCRFLQETQEFILKDRHDELTLRRASAAASSGTATPAGQHPHWIPHHCVM
ncbi:AfsR/SARP family transcriptional regulator [Actinoplanes flavus]|uniref:AfsR/SARP family transcriptional regulator n=1 Tax=Actinoplanes flavus TaxID=2820290 RepID=A0ABS3URE7_9ACTN|nr:AfsR/SARP family transcriptional regulator [Actinoplanes flavus]MBO3741342.1 AfsR/SARP family transcriptional regulator [Actinoplanes flavus]